MASTLCRNSGDSRTVRREIHFAFIDARDLLPADRGLHHGVDVADGEAIARRCRAVDPDDQIGLAEQVECRGIAYARHLARFRP